MSNCLYCNGTGYEAIKVKKYDGAMNEHYETYENHMCQYCGGRGHYPEISSAAAPSKSQNPAKKINKKNIPKKSDVSGNIAGISLIFAGIIAYFIYNAPNSELNIFVTTVATFIILNIVLHILYGLIVAMTKLGEFVLAVAFE